MESLLEHRVVTPAQPQVVLHALADEVDVDPRERSEDPRDQVGVVSKEVVEQDGHIERLPNHQIAPLGSCSRIQTRQFFVVPHLVLIEGAVTDVEFEGTCEMPLVVEGLPPALDDEQLVHAAPLKILHLAHEPLYHGRDSERLVWPVVENVQARPQFVPYRAVYLVGV